MKTINEKKKKKLPKIKRDKDGRPTTVIIDRPPYIGFVDVTLLEGVKSEEVKELTPAIKRDVAAIHRALEHGVFANNRTGLAIAHTQVNMRPYAFFCVAKSEDWEPLTIYNPKILETRGRGHRTKRELCLSFPEREHATIYRAEEVKAQFQVEEGGKLGAIKVEWLEGKPAQIFQHECEHIEGTHIYK